MKPVAIDFSARPANRRAIAALALGAAALAWSLWDYRAVAERLATAKAEAARVDAALAERVATPGSAPVRLSAAQIESINRAVTQINLPWNRILEVLEANAVKDVALLSVEPDGRRRALKIQAEARNPQAMLEFLAALRRHPLLAEVGPLRHEVLETDPEKPYRFVLEAIWKDAP